MESAQDNKERSAADVQQTTRNPRVRGTMCLAFSGSRARVWRLSATASCAVSTVRIQLIKRMQEKELNG